MANTINLGTFPISGGTPLDDQSLYLGNNKFIRIVTQYNNDMVTAIMYESSDVFSNTQTMTTLCEEVLLANTYLRYVAIVPLPSGNLAIIGSDRTTTARKKIYVISYDDINNTFNVIKDHTISAARMLLSYNSVYEVYGTDSILIGGNTNSFYSFGRIDGLETDVLSYTNYFYDTSHANYVYGQSMYSYLNNNHWFVAISSRDDVQGYSFDISNGTIDYSKSTGYHGAFKLDTDRYVLIKQDVNSYMQFGLSPTYSGSPDGSEPVYFIPMTSHKTNTDDVDRIRDFIPLDRQHFIFFYRPENSGFIYARFIKIIDENYGFVSDNSKDGLGIEVCPIVSDDTTITSFNNGRLVRKITDTTFWIQTNTNQFTFLTLSTGV